MCIDVFLIFFVFFLNVNVSICLLIAYLCFAGMSLPKCQRHKEILESQFHNENRKEIIHKPTEKKTLY